MMIANYVAAECGQHFARRLPQNLFAKFARARFSPHHCASILGDYVREDSEVGRFLSPDSVARGDAAGTDELLYPAPTPWLFGFVRSYTERAIHRRTPIKLLRLPAAATRPAADALRSMLTEDATDWSEAPLPFLTRDDLALIFDSNAQRQTWLEPAGPGIYRREHASLMVQSQHARLVIDPLCLSSTVPCVTTVRGDSDVDAVLITHSHPDHWHIPSILASARARHTPVIVPHVPKTTVLCPDMSRQLREVGQNVSCPTWGNVVTFSDVEVDILPFYGEQPAVDAHHPDPHVRNWGNCYRINTPDFSLLVLADSGKDTAGDMLEVVARSFAARGPVDLVVACMRDFLSPFEISGLEFYWATLPFRELERLYSLYEAGRLPTTTAGLTGGGIASICAEAHAAAVAPYAQGFAGIGNPVAAGDWGPSPTMCEAQALEELATQLAVAGVSTVVRAWNPGDGMLRAKGGLEPQRTCAEKIGAPRTALVNR